MYLPLCLQEIGKGGTPMEWPQLLKYIKLMKPSLWLSDKGIRYILAPKRGMATDINPDVAQPVTAVGQNNWTGTFISPEIDYIDRPTEIGGDVPTKIVLKNGRILYFDGLKFHE